MGLLALQRGSCYFDGGPGKLVAQTRLPHPLLHPSPQKGLFLALGQGTLQVTECGEGMSLVCLQSLGMRRAEINLNDPVFPGETL